MSDKTITYTESAITTIGAMHDHVVKLAKYFGSSDPRHLTASVSLARVMSQIVMAGFNNEASVSRDGDLSLYVVEGGFHYGVIFHGERRHCTVEGCKAVLNNDGTFWTYSGGFVCEGPHVPDYPYDAPMPGSWSTHS